MTVRAGCPRQSRVLGFGSALHLSIAVLAMLAEISYAYSPDRHLREARQASLTPPIVSLTDPTSSLTGSVSILPIATTTTELTTSIGPDGTSTFLTTVTTLVGPGPSNATTESESNISTTPTSTSTAFPSLGSYSACVDNCLQSAVSASNCSSVTDTACYCVSSIFPARLVQCVSDECTDELSTAEGLAQAFCNLSSPTVSLAFPAPSFSSNTSSAIASATSASASASATGNAGSSLRLGLTQGDIWGCSRIDLLSAIGIGIGFGALLC